MGILRSDRVSGLGGANAINGSVFFGGDQHLRVATSSEFDLSNSNFTLECWINFSGFDGTGFDTILMATLDGTAANTTFQFDYKNSTNNLRFIPYVSNSAVVYESSWTPVSGTWYHIAACRSGADLKLFVDGTQIGSTHNIGSQTVDGDDVPLGIGQRRGNLDRGVIGYISNFRLLVGTALYTSNFTAPAQRLTNIDNTVLLCCHSPGNALKEETGKTIESVLDNTNNAPPQASHFVPDVGEDYGTTFTDNTKFDTLSYMVPPGGTTTESNRGRAVMAGGETPSNTTNIQYVQMQSDGNATQFGSLTTASRKQFSCASSTRGIFGSGYAPSATNVIEYVTIATTSNVTNFGDIQQDGQCQGCSNNTRGIVAGGYGNPGDNIISYLTIATTGDSTDFGDLATGRYDIACLASSTRGLLPGGNVGAAANNTISYVTIASTGNDTDFGDSTSAFSGGSGVASSTRGGFALCTSQVNTIDYVTIASAGNAADFGDLIDGRSEIMNGGASNSIRGLFCGGQSPTIVNTIDYITIASTGNAKDFGDMNVTASATAAASDSHGGIS